MKKMFITNDSKQTQKLGEMLAEEMVIDKRFDLSLAKAEPKEVEPKNAFIICLSGELGAGKTTFTQGLLKGLKVKGPYTSPTFVIMKKYGKNIFHFDAYRVEKDDIINIGWEEIISNEKNIVIVEWADRISDIIPKNSLWVEFEWVDENRRKIILKNKL